MTNKQTGWQNQYPLRTYYGQEKKDLIEFIEYEIKEAEIRGGIDELKGMKTAVFGVNIGCSGHEEVVYWEDIMWRINFLEDKLKTLQND